MDERKNATAERRTHLQKVWVELELREETGREVIRAYVTEKKAERLRRVLGF